MLRVHVLTVAAALVAITLDMPEDRFFGQARGQEPRTVKALTAKQDFAWVPQRLDAWQPTAEERAMDQVGWAKDLREAQLLAKKHSRPVFLFTYDGASLADYRC